MTDQNTLASMEFCDAFHSGIGSYCAQCGCGRTHFAGADTTWAGNTEERLGLIAKAKTEPDKYIDTGECSVSLINLGGADYVNGCPCGTTARYEHWVWAMRKPVIEYIKARTSKELAEANAGAAMLDGLTGLGK